MKAVRAAVLEAWAHRLKPERRKSNPPVFLQEGRAAWTDTTISTAEVVFQRSGTAFGKREYFTGIWRHTSPKQREAQPEYEKEMEGLMQTAQQRTLKTAAEVLEIYATAPTVSCGEPLIDAGPAVLAALASATPYAGVQANAVAALNNWLTQLGKGPFYPGVYGGLASFYVGAWTASCLVPRLEALASVLCSSLAHWSTAGQWRREAVAWQDYDLISGPAGIVLSLTTEKACQPEEILCAAR